MFPMTFKYNSIDGVVDFTIICFIDIIEPLTPPISSFLPYAIRTLVNIT